MKQSFGKAYGFSTWITKWYIFAILVFPLFYDKWKYLALTRAKYTYYCTITIIALAAIVLRYISAWIGKEARPWRVSEIWKRTSVPMKLMLLFLLLGTLSSALSPYQDVVWKGDARYGGMLTILLYGLTYFTAASCGSWKRMFCWVIAAVTFVFSLIGILQYFGFDMLQLYPEGSGDEALRFLSTCGNVDFSCTYLCMALPMLFAGFAVSERGRRYYLLLPLTAGMFLLTLMDVDMGLVAILGAIICMLPLLLETKQRFENTCISGLICSISSLAGQISLDINDKKVIAYAVAAGAMLLLFALTKATKQRWFANKTRIRYTGMIVIIALLVSIVAASLKAFQTGSEGLLSDLGAFLSGQAPDYVGHGRVGIWRRSIEMGLQHPLLGSGADSFATEFYHKYAEFSTETAGVAIYDAAHNEFIHYFCLFGILGLLAYAGWLLTLIVRGYRAALAGSRISIFLLAGIIGYAVQSVFNLSIVIVAPYFFLLCGLMEAEARVCREKNKRKKETRETEIL